METNKYSAERHIKFYYVPNGQSEKNEKRTDIYYYSHVKSKSIPIGHVIETSDKRNNITLDAFNVDGKKISIDKLKFNNLHDYFHFTACKMEKSFERRNRLKKIRGRHQPEEEIDKDQQMERC